MCRILGCVASEPVSLRAELLEAHNPLIRQSEGHDSGWGIAVYRRGEGEAPHCMRFPEAAYADGQFAAATELRGRIFNVHVRRATIGGLSERNTHPFCLGSYSFSHNGTIGEFARLREPGVSAPHGDTDSELFFNFLVHDFDAARPVESLRRSVGAVAARLPFSGLNFMLSDGERLYAYRLGVFELHWRPAPGMVLVASERIGEPGTWHSVQQDVLLVLDPSDTDGPHAERLLGDAVVAAARVRDYVTPPDLRGARRGEFAARQAERLATAGGE